jgi:hypothetical protein
MIIETPIFINMLTSDNIKHCVITRFSYVDEDLFKIRLDILSKTLIPNLDNQTNQNFDWVIISKPIHDETIQKLYNKKIYFVRDSEDLKNFLITNKYTIQTRHDSDDLMCEEYIEKIQEDFITNSYLDHPFLIHFQPIKFDYFTKKKYVMKIQYQERNSTSAFISLCPQNTNMTIWDRTHTSWVGYVKTIIRNKTNECVWAGCHSNNTTTAINKGDIEIK